MPPASGGAVEDRIGESGGATFKCTIVLDEGMRATNAWARNPLLLPDSGRSRLGQGPLQLLRNWYFGGIIIVASWLRVFYALHHWFYSLHDAGAYRVVDAHILRPARAYTCVCR
jgi:hypothetical protein